MAEKHFKYVHLGGGQSGGYVAAEFVKNGLKPGELAIITAEKAVSYERPTLSKGFLKPDSPPRLPGFHSCVGGGGDKQEPAWYKEKGIEYLLNTKATGVDVKAKKIKLESGDTITYDKLIMATGCINTTLDQFGAKNAHLKGINYLRNVEDAEGLVEDFKAAKKSTDEAVVVGGGYIGMECTAGLVLNGFRVTMVFPEKHLMQRFFTPEIAGFYENYYKNKGVTFVREDVVTGFEGDSSGRVDAALTKAGKKLPASLVLVGVGAKPAVELVKDQLDTLNDAPGGIKVNSQLQTSNPDVYAVGDIAAFPLTLYGGKLNRQEHVTHARQSGSHAVKAIFGNKEEYEYLPYFYSREFDLSWCFYGVNEGDPVIFGDLQNGKFGAYWVKDGQVVGAFAESASGEQQQAIRQVALRKPKAPSMEELEQQGFDFALKQAKAPATAAFSSAMPAGRRSYSTIQCRVTPMLQTYSRPSPVQQASRPAFRMPIAAARPAFTRTRLGGVCAAGAVALHTVCTARLW
jgi:monodehydroascorbate reductase (NADH)